MARSWQLYTKLIFTHIEKNEVPAFISDKLKKYPLYLVLDCIFFILEEIIFYLFFVSTEFLVDFTFRKP